jgi:hypothetical protein
MMKEVQKSRMVFRCKYLILTGPQPNPPNRAA